MYTLAKTTLETISEEPPVISSEFPNLVHLMTTEPAPLAEEDVVESSKKLVSGHVSCHTYCSRMRVKNEPPCWCHPLNMAPISAPRHILLALSDPVCTIITTPTCRVLFLIPFMALV